MQTHISQYADTSGCYISRPPPAHLTRHALRCAERQVLSLLALLAAPFASVFVLVYLTRHALRCAASTGRLRRTNTLKRRACVSFCTFVRVKQKNRERWLRRTNTLKRRFCVSICTFVRVKQVNRGRWLRRTKTLKRRACVSICTFVRVKQVNRGRWLRRRASRRASRIALAA
jgi:hypothetical protein